MSDWTERLLRVRREERGTVGLLFVYFFSLIGAALIVGRTLGTTLFLSRVPTELLPLTYVLSAVVVGLVSALYTRLLKRSASPHLPAQTALGFAVGCLGLRALLGQHPSALLLMAALYVFFDVVSDVGLIQFWTLAQSRLNARQAKRVFGLIGAGGTIAGIALGGALPWVVAQLGAPNLLFVAAGLLFACAACARKLAKAPTLERSDPAQRGQVDSAKLLKLRFPRALLLTVGLATVVTVLLDYRWKLDAAAAFRGDEAGLAGYFGAFYLVTNTIALVFQLALTPRLLERYGLTGALLSVPSTLAIGAIASLLGAARGQLTLTTLAKGADGALRYSVYEPAFQVLYRPFEPKLRARAKAVIDGICRPACAAGTGLLIALAQIQGRALWIIVGVGALLWLLLAYRLKSLYARTLVDALERHVSLDSGALNLDTTTAKVLRRALLSEDPRKAHHALTLLRELPDRGWAKLLAPLLERPDSSVRRAALEMLASAGAPAPAVTIDDLHAEAPGTRAAAIACVVHSGSLSQLLTAARALERMCIAADFEERAAAARALGWIGASRFFEPLLELLTDEHPLVVQEATEAAQRAPHRALADVLLALLLQPRLQSSAQRALVAIGPTLIGRLEALLLDENAPQRQRVSITKVLEKLGSQAQLALKEGALSAAEPVRHACILAIRDLSSPDLDRLCLQELKETSRLSSARRALEPVHPQLLGEVLHAQIERARTRVLHLLSLKHPQAGIERASEALLDACRDRRATALELLDNALMEPLKTPVLQMLEPRRRTEPGVSREQALRSLLSSQEPWTLSCALWELKERPVAALGPMVHALRQHAHPWVREVAILAGDKHD